MKKAVSLAVCSVVTALSVILLFLGGITYILAYAMPMFVGFFMIMLKRTFGTSSAWITYAATSALSFMLISDKECMLMYVLFFGFYPIIKSGFNKISSNILRLIVKLLLFNVLFAAVQVLLVYVFGIPFLEEGEAVYLAVVFMLLMNFVFLIYDRLINKIEKLYILKIEKRIKKLLK